MTQENRKCENCGRDMGQAAYIPFNGGMIVCFPCSDGWGKLSSPESIVEYHEVISKREDYRTDLIAKK